MPADAQRVAGLRRVIRLPISPRRRASTAGERCPTDPRSDESATMLRSCHRTPGPAIRFQHARLHAEAEAADRVASGAKRARFEPETSPKANQERPMAARPREPIPSLCTDDCSRKACVPCQSRASAKPGYAHGAPPTRGSSGPASAFRVARSSASDEGITPASVSWGAAHPDEPITVES